MIVPNSIRNALNADERLLWHGKPRTDFLFVPYDRWAIAALGLFLSVGVALFVLISSKLGFNLTSMFVLIIMLIPLILFAARFPLDLMKRRNTDYFVTNKRVAIKTDTMLDRKITSKKYNEKFIMTPIDAPNGSTTIYFGSMSPFWDYFYPPNYPLMDMFQPPAFMFIDNAVEVMNTIIDAKRSLANNAR